MTKLFSMLGYGVEPDERQRLERYRADSRTLRWVVVACLAGLVVGQVIGNMVLSLALAGVILVVVVAHSTSRSASEWEQYVREQIAARPELRRRALRSTVLRGTVFGLIVVAYDIADGAGLLQIAITWLVSAAFFMFVDWWIDLRPGWRSVENQK